MISFKVSKRDRELIKRVAKRAQSCAQVLKIDEIDLVTIEMDLTACHRNGCPLNFEKMLMARGGDLLHDVLGINRHLSRTTGKLQNHFHPRCAA